MANGVLWSLVERTGVQGVSFITFMFVARLIGPKEYGLASICFVYFYVAVVLISGLADGIISLQIQESRRLSTIFWCVMGVGCTLTVICMITAGPVAAYMEAPQVKILLQWYSLVFIFLALFTIVQKILISKLKFRFIALCTLVASLISGAVGLTLAFAGFGAFAIVGQQLSFFAAINMIVWRYVGWRPEFVFDITGLKTSLAPGLKSISTGGVDFAEEQVPRILIAAVLGSTSLGYYVFVNRIRYAIQDLLFVTSLGVVYPSLSQIKDDLAKQTSILEMTITAAGICMFPVLAMAAYEAPAYVRLLFGVAWTPAVPVLQVIILAHMVSPISIVVRESLRAHNRMGAFIKIQIPIVITQIIVLWLVLPNGILAMAIGIFCCYIVAAPIYIAYFKRQLGISLWKPVLSLWKPLTSVLIMLVSVSIYQKLNLFPALSWLGLLSSLALGILAYFGACLVVLPREAMQITAVAREMFTRRLRLATT